MSAHRRPGKPVRRLHGDDFLARHCAGTGCFHTHPGEEPLPVFPGLEDVPAKCDRKGTHGAHDVEDGRCPGHQEPAGLPAARVAEHAARVRQEIGGNR